MSDTFFLIVIIVIVISGFFCALSRLLLPYKVLFFFPPPPCFRECAVVRQQVLPDDVAEGARVVFILSHYENIFYFAL